MACWPGPTAVTRYVPEFLTVNLSETLPLPSVVPDCTRERPASRVLCMSSARVSVIEIWVFGAKFDALSVNDSLVQAECGPVTLGRPVMVSVVDADSIELQRVVVARTLTWPARRGARNLALADPPELETVIERSPSVTLTLQPLCT